MTESQSEPVFRGYAKFYDLLYAEKDYVAECRFLERIFAANGVDAGSSVLDLGCGTGSHVVPLAQSGYVVTGVDRSDEMVAIAKRKASAVGLSPSLIVADVRELRLHRCFDAVISMFAVVGYQLSNDDLAAMLSAARGHLNVGGLLVFDAWFGPTVLTARPETKRKTVVLEGGEELVRLARPTLDVIAQTVRVDYELVRERADGGPVNEVTESHTMRFFFAQEMAYFLAVAGFEVISLTPFMAEGVTPTDHDWNVTWVARAV